MTPTGRLGLTLFVACSVTFAVPLAGQSAVVTGTVRAQSGAPIAGASVAAGAREVRTSEAGRFSLAVPADTALTLEVSAVGFAPATLGLDPLPPGGRRTVALTLQPFYVLDAITVTTRKPRPLLNTENATTGGTLEQEELRALPTDSRDPLSLAYTIPGVVPATGFFGDAPPLSLDGANSLYTQYTLDGLDNNEGFLGGPRVEFPLAALSRLSVLNNTYGAEYGRSPTGIVNEESRGGSDSTHGEVLAYWRPGIPFDAAPKLTPPGTDPKGFRRFQLGAGASGPLARDRTFYSLAAEYTNENEDRIGSTARTQFIGSELRQTTKLFGRLDHGWSPTQTTTLRVAFSGVSRAGQGTGVIVPEADITTKRIGSLTALTHRSVLAGGRGSNTASAQLGTYHWYFPPTASTLSVPQVTIVAPDGTTVEAVVGSSNFIFDEHEHQLQLRDVVELDLGTSHNLSFGADAIRGWFTLAGASTNPNGSYVVYDDGNIVPHGRFVSINDIPSNVRVKSYTIDANPQEVDLSQTRGGRLRAGPLAAHGIPHRAGGIALGLRRHHQPRREQPRSQQPAAAGVVQLAAGTKSGDSRRHRALHRQAAIHRLFRRDSVRARRQRARHFRGGDRLSAAGVRAGSHRGRSAESARLAPAARGAPHLRARSPAAVQPPGLAGHPGSAG